MLCRRIGLCEIVFGAICCSWLNSCFSVARGTPEIVDEPLRPYRPQFVDELEMDRSKCFQLMLPQGVERAKVIVSVVNLVGYHSMHLGWQPKEPSSVGVDSGYQVREVEDDVLPESFYHICIRTVSTNSCSFILTAVAIDAVAKSTNAILLLPSYPIVWPVGKTVKALPSQDFLLRISDTHISNGVSLSAVPVDGSFKVAVFGSSDCLSTPLGVKHVAGPTAINLDIKALEKISSDIDRLGEAIICVKVEGNGTVALNAGPRLLGAMLAPQLPVATLLRRDNCDHMRLRLHTPNDITLTALAEDGSQLDLTATVDSLAGRSPNGWNAIQSSSSEGTVLVIDKLSVKEQCEDSTRYWSCEILKVSICRHPGAESADETVVWLTAMTASGVSQLKDGIPQETKIEHRSGPHDQWRDFRYLIPGGSATPDFVTIQGTTIGKAMLVADTFHFTHDFKAFRFESENSSLPTLRFTTSRQWQSDEVAWIDCRPPCFLYVSACAWMPGHPREDAELKLTAASEQKSMPIPLVEGNAITQRLVKEELQVFTYELAEPQADLIFSLSTSEGSVEMKVSAESKCPEDESLSTPWAQSTIILTPSTLPYEHAIRKARYATPTRKQVPKLFVCTRSTSEDTSAFTIVARRESDAVILQNGMQVAGAVEPFRQDRYRFFVSEAEMEKKPIEISVHITPVLGDPDLYISCHTDHPDEKNNDWGGARVGQDALYFTSHSARFRPGWIHVVVTSKEKASYSLRAEWGTQKVVLDDGKEEIGHCMRNDVRPYVLEVSERQEHDAPVVIRAEAWMGAFSLCVVNLDTKSSNQQLPSVIDSKKSLDCLFKATGDADRQAEAGAGLAAIDIPPQTLQQGGKLALLVQGLKHNNAFALRGLVEAPMILAEGHDLVDALGPTCCVKGDVWQQLLRRRYRTFVKPEPGATIEVHSLGDGSLVGATLKARQLPMEVTSDDDVEHDATPWRFETDAKEGSLVTDSLKIEADLTFVDREFWLEIELSTIRPVNYTLKITTKGIQKVQDAQKQLQPGLKENVRAVSSKVFQFPLDPRAEDGEWELELRQCYGRVSVDLPYCSDCPANLTNGTDFNLPLPTHGLKPNSGSINAAGSARIQPITATPVIYEMTLKSAGASENESPVFFKDAPLLKRTLWGKLSFDFTAAQINKSRLHNLLPDQEEAALFYELVAVPVNKSLLNANSTCGIAEAIRRKEVVSVRISQGDTLGKRRLSGTLPKLTEGAYKINVLVSLVNQNGKALASRCYLPLDLDLRKQAFTPPVQSKMLGGLLAILLMAAVCYFTTRERNNASRSFAIKEAIEMEDPYELQQSDCESPIIHKSSQRKRGAYVPPGFA